VNFIDAAQERFPAVTRIIGSGRFAVAAQNGLVVYLSMTESQQHAIARGIDNPVFADLVPTPCPQLKDDWEDRQRERREKREEKFRARY